MSSFFPPMWVQSSVWVSCCTYQHVTVSQISVIVGLWFDLWSGCTRFVFALSTYYKLKVHLFFFTLFFFCLLTCNSRVSGTLLCWQGHVWKSFRFHEVICWPSGLLKFSSFPLNLLFVKHCCSNFILFLYLRHSPLVTKSTSLLNCNKYI